MKGAEMAGEPNVSQSIRTQLGGDIGEGWRQRKKIRAGIVILCHGGHEIKT